MTRGARQIWRTLTRSRDTTLRFCANGLEGRLGRGARFCNPTDSCHSTGCDDRARDQAPVPQPLLAPSKRHVPLYGAVSFQSISIALIRRLASSARSQEGKDGKEWVKKGLASWPEEDN